MIEFILNDRLIRGREAPGMPLLDFIRYTAGLSGTKSGCREGDCGACTVMEGRLQKGRLHYRTLVSCLTPLGKVHGSHIVTVEGLNTERLSPAQQAIAEHGATQCGFCTPGFVVSLTAHSLSPEAADPRKAVAALDGNICRCTGYKSIERAAEALARTFASGDGANSIGQMVKHKQLPEYFGRIAERLARIESPLREDRNGIPMAGGTDLLVQRPDEMAEAGLHFLSGDSSLKAIRAANGRCTIGAAVTATEIGNSAELQSYFPGLEDFFRLIASTPVRNMGTLGGNLANASPIGDLSIFFLALDARLRLRNRQGEKREVLLRDFFKAYKKLDLKQGEIIEQLHFRLPAQGEVFNFEKVSKRTHLDIASVNTAIRIRVENGTLAEALLSAGGVAPVPLFLARTSEFLKGKKLTEETLRLANGVMQSEIAPISDIRGSDTYKRLLLRQLFFAHFLKLFPAGISLSKLIGQRK